MVTTSYGEASSPRNCPTRVFPVAGLDRDPAPSDSPSPRPRDTRRILLSALAGSQGVAIGDLVGLLPEHPQPLSAVLDLVEAGDAVIDLDCAFDASSRVWLTPSPRV